jgi:hypothetical protein
MKKALFVFSLLAITYGLYAQAIIDSSIAD